VAHFIEFTYGAKGEHTVVVDLERVGAVVAQRAADGRMSEVRVTFDAGAVLVFNAEEGAQEFMDHFAAYLGAVKRTQPPV
jgi:hypothetical protein